VNLVRERHSQNILVDLPQFREIGFLSLSPNCLALPFPRIGETIRGGFDDPRHALAEPVANIIQPRLALIFDVIVQKCRNGEVFVTAVL
jgi:hypothetical protein